jgi:hypothetical protein
MNNSQAMRVAGGLFFAAAAAFVFAGWLGAQVVFFGVAAAFFCVGIVFIAQASKASS